MESAAFDFFNSPARALDQERPTRAAVHRVALRAKEMLAETSQPIADIAYALGYSSQAHFTPIFRKMTGISPGAYRSSSITPAKPDFAESLNDHGSV